MAHPLHPLCFGHQQVAVSFLKKHPLYRYLKILTSSGLQTHNAYAQWLSEVRTSTRSIFSKGMFSSSKMFAKSKPSIHEFDEKKPN